MGCCSSSREAGGSGDSANDGARGIGEERSNFCDRSPRSTGADIAKAHEMSSTNHSVSIEESSIGHPDTARICASLSSPDFDGAFGGDEAESVAVEMSCGREAGEGTKHSQSAAEALVPVQLEHSDSSIPIGTPVDDHPAPMVEACAEHSAGNLSWAEQSLESSGLCGVTLPHDWLKGIELADPRDDQAEAAASVVVGKWAAKRYENAHAKLMMVGCKLSVATLMRCPHSPR